MPAESPLDMMRGEPPRRPTRTGASGQSTTAGSSRRLRLIAGSIAVIVVLTAGWCGLWYCAASVAGRTLAGWMAREAAAGRVYRCGSERVAGFPFSIVVHCLQATASIDSAQPPFTVAAKDVTFTAQVYRPTHLVADVAAPLGVSAPGQPPNFIATWSLAQLSVNGLPPNPDAVSIKLEQPRLDADAGASTTTLFVADGAALNARVIGGSAGNHPVIEAVLHFASATAPSVHPLLAEPLQGDAEIILRGFKDLSPKPLAERFRELQASGGAIEIRSLRIERADAIVSGVGTLTVNAQGRLDGVIRVVVSGFESIVPQLGIDKLIGEGLDRLAGSPGLEQGLSALDRLVPGLGGVVRGGANASVIDDLKKMGQPTQIDGKPATALPLRFADGAVYLGMIRIGQVPALF